MLRDIELHLLEQSVPSSGEFQTVLSHLYASDYRQAVESNPSISIALSEDSTICSEEVCLVAGCVALQAFMQLNWTGPSAIDLPECLSVRSYPGFSEGELFRQCRNPWLLWKARDLFTKLTLESGSVWRGRAAFALQRVLLEASDRGEGQIAHLIDLSITEVVGILGDWGVLEISEITEVKKELSWMVPNAFSEEISDSTTPSNPLVISPNLGSQLICEIGSRLCYYQKTNCLVSILRRASFLADFSFEVTGVDGMRRKFQTQAFAQMTCIVGVNSAKDEITPQAPSLVTPRQVTLEEVEPETDILENTKFISSNDRNLPLSASQQSLLLLAAYCELQDSPAREALSLEKVAALTARALIKDKTSADWLIFSFGLYLRCQSENNRGMTKGRSCFQLEALVAQFDDKEPNNRSKFVYSIAYPSIWEMQRELGIRMMEVGMLLTAYEMFARLEMWENAVDCLVVAGRKSQAIEMLDAFEKDGKISPPLLCSLGDLTKNIDAYQRAWEMSDYRCARAQRCLGRYHMKSGSLVEAALCFERSLAVSPLHADIWFSLGAIYMKLDGDAYSDRSANAFVRSLGLSEEDAQTWGNLCAVYSREPKFIEKAKLAAYEAVKRSHGSWKLWENYYLMCQRTNDLQGMLQCQRTLAITLNRSNDYPDIPTLKRIAIEAVSRKSKEPALFEKTVQLLEDLAASNKGGWALISVYANLQQVIGVELKALELRIRSLRLIVGDLEARDAIQGLQDCLEALEELVIVAEPSSVSGLVMTLKSIPKKLAALKQENEEINQLCEKVKFAAQKDSAITE